jgi:hypothetical protein
MASEVEMCALEGDMHTEISSLRELVVLAFAQKVPSSQGRGTWHVSCRSVILGVV